MCECFLLVFRQWHVFKRFTQTSTPPPPPAKRCTLTQRQRNSHTHTHTHAQTLICKRNNKRRPLWPINPLPLPSPPHSASEFPFFPPNTPTLATFPAPKRLLSVCRGHHWAAGEAFVGWWAWIGLGGYGRQWAGLAKTKRACNFYKGSKRSVCECVVLKK